MNSFRKTRITNDRLFALNLKSNLNIVQCCRTSVLPGSICFEHSDWGKNTHINRADKSVIMGKFPSFQNAKCDILNAEISLLHLNVSNVCWFYPISKKGEGGPLEKNRRWSRKIQNCPSKLSADVYGFFFRSRMK